MRGIIISKSSIDLQNFFPKNQLKVVDILEDKKQT